MDFSAFISPRASFRGWLQRRADFRQLKGTSQLQDFRELQQAYPDVTAGTTARDWSRDPKRGFMQQAGTRVSRSADIDPKSIVYGKGVVTGLTKVRNSSIAGEVTRFATVINSHVFAGGLATGQLHVENAWVNRADTPRENVTISRDQFYLDPLLEAPKLAEAAKLTQQQPRIMPEQPPQRHQQSRPLTLVIRETNRSTAAAMGD